MGAVSRFKPTTYPLDWEVAQMLIRKSQEEVESKTSRLAYLLFLVGFYTGFRWSDMRWLKFEDFSQEYMVVREQKTNKVRRVRLHPTVREGVNFVRYRFELEGNDFLFWEPMRKAVNVKNQVRVQPMSLQGACWIMQKYFKKYGVRGIPSTHTLRKTFAWRVYDNGGRTNEALHLVSAMLNHYNIEMTMTYIGLSVNAIKVQEAYLNL